MNDVNRENLSPAMRHYLEMKDQVPDTFLFYRMGDFYELFFDDAIIVSELLDLTLTGKHGGLEEKIPMCGVPYRSVNLYIGKLVQKGYKVTICDQVEDPKEAKGLVKREITKIITPGTFTDEMYLDDNDNRFILALTVIEDTIILSYCDYLTGELQTVREKFDSVETFISRIQSQIAAIKPLEILIPENILYKEELISILERDHIFITVYPKDSLEEAYLKENRDFVQSLLSSSTEISPSFYLLFDYLRKTQGDELSHLTQEVMQSNHSYMPLSKSTITHLELMDTLYTKGEEYSLFHVLNHTTTAMGARLLKQWILHPLTDRDAILERQQGVATLKEERILRDYLKDDFKNIYDIDRLSIKISQKTLKPIDMIQIKKTLKAANSIRSRLIKSEDPYLREFSLKIETIDMLIDEIENQIIEDTNLSIQSDRVIKKGYSKELDELFQNSEGGSQWILDLENSEREKTGIKNLKIKYNKILGYFIEVTNANLNQVPDDYIRKQTLVGSERFFTTELKEQEAKILSAKDDAFSLQLEIFNTLQDAIFDHLKQIQKIAKKIAYLDCLYSLAFIADENHYIRPIFNNEAKLEIQDGRHPVVEVYNELGDYIPNDIELSNDSDFIKIITGPNMAGKSTYMRQVAIICLMAQMGCFVPASYCNVPILDQIFTRIGASDNLAEGKSTFMVEMLEVSEILKNCTEKSLIILDEVGRGTGTNDGLSIARAIIEYIYTVKKSKTLFATHYFELTELAEKNDSIGNLTIATEKRNGEIHFLRKIIEGASDHSYGIDVAKLAKIEPAIIRRAHELLEEIEKEYTHKPVQSAVNLEDVSSIGQPVEWENTIQKLREININQTTPMEALFILEELQREVKEE